MKYNNKIGLACIILGCIFILMAITIYVVNEEEQIVAGNSSAKIVDSLGAHLQAVEDKVQDSIAQGEEIEEHIGLTEVEIDGAFYIGILEIPSLNIQLPIQSELTMDALKISPCTYQGSMPEKNMIIGAHNYKTHLGPIRNMKEDDLAFITDMDGKVYEYKVEKVEKISGDDSESLITGNHALSLFTCDYNRSKRVVVRLVLVN